MWSSHKKLLKVTKAGLKIISEGGPGFLELSEPVWILDQQVKHSPNFFIFLPYFRKSLFLVYTFEFSSLKS